MRCPHCGFIRDTDFNECPYCGHIIGNQKFLNKRVTLNNHSSIKLSTLFTIAFINIFIAILIIDIFYSFKYFLTLSAYIVLMLVAVIFRIMNKKKSGIMIVENLDFYFVTSLILLTTLLPAYFINNADFMNAWNMSPTLSHINPGSFFAFLVIPSFLLVVSILIVVMFFVSRKEKFRPIITGSILNFHFLMSLVLFVLLVVAKNNPSVASYVITYQSVPGDWLNVFEEVVVSLSFIINALIFVNFNLMLIGSIINNSGTVYGKNKKD